MADQRLAELLGDWEGFEIAGIERVPARPGQPVPKLVITLRPVRDAPKRCSRCGEVVTELHDVTERRIRDLPILEWETWVVFPRARLACPRCGPTVEAVPWLDRYQRMTKRLAEAIARLAMVLPIKHVAAWFGVGWETVKAIDTRALRTRLEPVDCTGVRWIAIDEFAVHKGHRYATTVVDVERRRVLWVGRGRAREDLTPFFELLGPEGCAAIEVAVMDMSEAYEQATRAHCPHVAIVYDLFHVVAKYGREVVDRVRVAEAKRYAQDDVMRRVIKGTRWLLLRNREHIVAPQARQHLRDLLALNRRLWVVYVLKDALKALWRYRSTAAAHGAWMRWYGWAVRSRIPELVAFARHLKAKLPGILAHCRYPLHTGLLEGINNKIKVLKRMAYGFRDDAYFFLKIRAAFPGIP